MAHKSCVHWLRKELERGRKKNVNSKQKCRRWRKISHDIFIK